VQPVAHDDRETHAAADPDQREVRYALGRPDPGLGDRRQVHVVLERDRPVEVGVERVAQAVMPAREVEGERDVAAGRVDHARGAEHDPADPVPRRVGLLGRLDDRGVHPPDRVVRVVGGDLDPGGEPARDVGRPGDHAGRADVDAHDVRAARNHGVELRVRAPPAGELADPGHQLALLQPFDQLGRGDLGETGQFAELGPGEGPALEQQVERGAVIDRAQQARRAGQAGLTHSGNGP
jgi:hypothetical protein